MPDAPDYSAFVKTVPSAQGLTELGELIDRLREAQVKHAEAEQALKESASRLKQLEQHDVPEMMARLRLSSFRTDEGYVVEVEDVVAASVTEANREAAFRWMEENQHGGHIKTRVEVSFPTKQLELAARLQTELEKQFPGAVTAERWVESSTLRAFVRRVIETEKDLAKQARSPEPGKALPREVFGVHEFSRAKVIPPKKK